MSHHLSTVKFLGNQTQTSELAGKPGEPDIRCLFHTRDPTALHALAPLWSGEFLKCKEIYSYIVFAAEPDPAGCGGGCSGHSYGL